jgi:hypothetical protein
MKLLLEQAWSSNPINRGTMSQIGVQLKFLESKQVAYLAEQQLQIELQQQQQLTMAAVAAVTAAVTASSSPTLAANNGFFIDNMSYCMAPSPPSKHHNHHSYHQNHHTNGMDDSIGTIETCSLSDSSGYFY